MKKPLTRQQFRELYGSLEEHKKNPRAQATIRLSDAVQTVRSVPLSTERNVLRVLAIPDIHFPKHDPIAISIAQRFIEIDKPDVIVLLGDLLDCESLSRHEISAGNMMQKRYLLSEEIESAREFQYHCINNSKKVYWLGGNHEEGRLKRLVNANPGTYTLKATQPEVFFDMPEEIEFVPEGTVLRIGPACFEHGHNIINSRGSKHIANTMLERRPFTHTFTGHWHCYDAKARVHYTSEGLPQTMYTVSCGHLSLVREHSHYAKLPNWTKGFVSIDICDDDLWWRFHEIRNNRLFCEHGVIEYG